MNGEVFLPPVTVRLCRFTVTLSGTSGAEVCGAKSLQIKETKQAVFPGPGQDPG